MRESTKAALFLGMLAACRPRDEEEDGALTVGATLNDKNPTVVHLEWSTAEPGTSWVEFGPDESYGTVIPTSAASTDHRFSLYGAPALSTVWWHAVTETEGATLEATGSLQVGNVGADLPQMEVDLGDPDQWSSHPYFLGGIVGSQTHVFIVDRMGNPLWYWWANEEFQGELALLSRVEFARGSRDIYYETYTWDMKPQTSGIHRVSLDGEKVRDVPVANCHHGFTEKGDGTLLLHVADIRPWYDESEGETVQVAGDAILQVFPDDTQAELFNAWDWEPVTESWRSDAGSTYGDAVDWTHANGLEWYEDGTLLYSLGHLQRILEMDADTAEILRTFGVGGIEVQPPAEPFEFQHSPIWTPEGNLMMTSNQGHDEIIAVEYAVGDEGLTEAWSFGKDKGYVSQAAGEVLRLENGNTLFVVGTTGNVLEISPDGEVVWSMVAGVGSAFTWIRPFDSFYVEE